MRRTRVSASSGDRLLPLTRSQIMARVRGRDTKPELIVRRLLHQLGYRFHLQGKELPGRPDIVFARRKLALFVHGCFWHGHDCARGSRLPKTNAQYWIAKIEANRARDARVTAELAAMEWRSGCVWECELRNAEALAERLRPMLGPPRWRSADGGVSIDMA